jgi:hypothetical protein
MANHGPLKKPPMASMPVLLFLADHPELLYVVSGTSMHNSYHFAYENGAQYRDANYYETHNFSRNETKEKPKWYYNDLAPEISKSLADHRWHQSGWIKQAKKVCNLDDKGNEDNHWAWYDHPARMTAAGREIANKYRAEYEKFAAKKLAKQKVIERLIVVKDDVGYGSNRKYGFLARVVKETKTRLYVEHIPHDGEKKSRHVYFHALHGSRGHEYVDRADVVAENVTEAEFHAMYRVETSNIAWADNLREQEEAEIQVIRDRYDQRREQNQYAFEDELREALAKVKNNA